MLHNMLRAAAGASFDPLSLSPLVFYDPSDMSTLWQDTAGTTPVTASGQVVKRIDDKSGNGYHALSKNGLGLTLTADGYLNRDGVNEGLIVTIPNFAFPCYTIQASGRNGSTGASAHIPIANTSDNANSAAVGFADGTSARAFLFDDSAFNASTVSNSDQKAILTGKFLSGNQRLSVNGGADGPNASASAISGANSLGILVLNRGGSTEPFYYAGETGGYLYFNYALSAAETDSCEQWMADRYGVTL